MKFNRSITCYSFEEIKHMPYVLRGGEWSKSYEKLRNKKGLVSKTTANNMGFPVADGEKIIAFIYNHNVYKKYGKPFIPLFNRRKQMKELPILFPWHLEDLELYHCPRSCMKRWSIKRFAGIPIIALSYDLLTNSYEAIYDISRCEQYEELRLERMLDVSLRYGYALKQRRIDKGYHRGAYLDKNTNSYVRLGGENAEELVNKPNPLYEKGFKSNLSN